MAASVSAFLASHKFDLDGIDPEKLLRAFRREMSAGLAGKDSSLAMIPAFVRADGKVPAGTPVVVLDAGGTNLRVTTVTFGEDGAPTVAPFRKTPMPGTRGKLSNAAFFDALADAMEPVLKSFKAPASGKLDVGFCFSYPATITPELDAVLIRWSKEVDAPGIVGKTIGASLAKVLKKRGYNVRFIVLNDTVATLLSGKSAGKGKAYAGYVGFILGTGTNTAYVEKVAKIGKLKDAGVELDAKSMIINVESGNFSKAPASDFDDLFDATTKTVGMYRFEKMISGGYLGGLGEVVLKCAAKEGLFSADGAGKIAKISNLSNMDLDNFSADPADGGALTALALSAADAKVVARLAKAVYTRAAKLAAINIAAAALAGTGWRASKDPVLVDVDGSTYYRTRSVAFEKIVRKDLSAILGPKGVKVQLVGADDAPIVGAAVAGLTC